jgi:hypothetical protein
MHKNANRRAGDAAVRQVISSNDWPSTNSRRHLTVQALNIRSYVFGVVGAPATGGGQ